MNTTCETTVDLQNATSLIAFVYQPSEMILFKIIWPCMIIFGVISNILLIWTVVRVSSLHNSMYTTLASLACSDIGILVGQGMVHVEDVFSSPVRRANIDRFKVPFFMLASFCYTSSFGFITLVSIERYLAICHPIRHHLLKGLKRTFKLICLVLLLSLAAMVVTMQYVLNFSSACVLWPTDPEYINYPRIIQLSVPNCQESGVLVQIGDILSTCFTTSATLCNCVMYIRVLQELTKRKRSTTLPTSAELEKSIGQASIMVIVNGSVFCLCLILVCAFAFTNVLYSVFNLIKEIHCVLLRAVGFTFIVFNASVNPVIYFTVNQRYRNAFMESIKNIYCRQ